MPLPVRPPRIAPVLHPAWLGSLAWLRGLRPEPVTGWRILEIGCHDGGHLLNLSLALPAAELHGVEADPARRAQAGAQGVRVHASLEKVAGLFDCILIPAYSTLPDALRKAALAFCRDHLAAQGLACVGYAARPAADLLVSLRQSARQAGPLASEQLSGWLAGFAELYAQAPDSHYQAQHEWLARWREDPDSLQAFLNQPFEPLYLHEFLQRAHEAGLHYLGNAQAPGPLPTDRATDAWLAQCRDFLQPAALHYGLLSCAEPRPADLAEAAQALRWASPFQPLSETPGIQHPGLIVRYQDQAGQILAESEPLAKAALCCLAECWPASLSFQEMYRAACQRLATFGWEIPADTLAEALLAHWQDGRLMPLAADFPGALPGHRPLASPLARYQAAAGLAVFNLRNQATDLPPVAFNLLPYLDGTRDHAALIGVLREWVALGYLSRPGTPSTSSPSTSSGDGGPFPEPVEEDAALAELLGQILALLGQEALCLA